MRRVLKFAAAATGRPFTAAPPPPRPPPVLLSRRFGRAALLGVGGGGASSVALAFTWPSFLSSNRGSNAKDAPASSGGGGPVSPEDIKYLEEGFAKMQVRKNHWQA